MSKLYYEPAAVSSAGAADGTPFILRGSAEEPKYVKSVQIAASTGNAILTFYHEREKVAEFFVPTSTAFPYDFRMLIKRDLGDYKQLKIFVRPAAGSTAVTVNMNLKYLIMK